MGVRPGGEMATRPLHFIWMVDCSGSMAGDKIQTLNTAIRESIPHMRDAANENPNAQVLVRVLRFSDGAQWHVSAPTQVDVFAWTDLEADGVTDMGKALEMVAEQLKMPPMTDRALPPVVVLVSDGQPTDDFTRGLRAVMDQPWGKKAVRLAIAIGDDADEDVLRRFVGNSELPVLRANNPQALIRFVRWVSTEVVKSVSMPASQVAGASPSASNVPVPAPPSPVPSDAPDSALDVW